MREHFRTHIIVTEEDRKLPLYIESVGYLTHQSAIHRNSGYPEYHWLQTVEGCGRFEYAGRSVELMPSQGILLPPYSPHDYQPITPKWSTIFVTFGGSLAKHILNALELYHPSLYRIEQPAALLASLDHMIATAKNVTNYSGADRSPDLYQFLVLLKKHGSAASSVSAIVNLHRITALLAWLDQHYSDPSLSLADMSSRLHLTPQRLTTLFRNAVGSSPYAYLIQIRMQKAKDLLTLQLEMTNKEIAAAVGFKDQSHFIATFHKQTGMTPNQFRKLYES